MSELHYERTHPESRDDKAPTRDDHRNSERSTPNTQTGRWGFGRVVLLLCRENSEAFREANPAVVGPTPFPGQIFG